MTNSLHAYGVLLEASENDRVLRYKLLPFGEVGRTNLGALTASKGAIRIPSDISHLVLNTEHAQDSPVGRFVSVDEQDDALYASVTVAEFERGDDALKAVRAGDMTGISVEVRQPVIRDGVLIAGELTGAALCKTPAFPSAMLTASDTGELAEAISEIFAESLASLVDAARAAGEASVPSGWVEQVTNKIREALAPAEEPAPETPEEEPVEASEEPQTAEAEAEATTEKEDDMSETNAAPAAEMLSAAALGAGNGKSALEALADALVDGASMGASGALHAAISDITAANSYDKTAVPAYVGELYQTGRNYTAKFAPLLGQKPLTSKTIKGWKFDVLPEVAYDYAGFPAALASNSPTVSEVTATATELAGGHALDRLTLTLNDGGYVAAYLRECADDWDRKLDVKVLDRIGGISTAVTGVSGNAYRKLLKGAQLVAETGTPEWAIVGADLYLELMETTDANKLALLTASIGLKEGALAGFKIISAPLSRADFNGKVIVGSSKALELYTLPGGPVRVNAVDFERNGELRGVWGAYAFLEHDRRELVKVSA